MATKSVIKYGSELGLWMGLYLCIASLCLLCSVYVPSLILLVPVIILGWPVLLWLLQSKIWREQPEHRSTSSMAVAGAWICFFGALIVSTFSLAWIKLLQPDFLHMLVVRSIEAARDAEVQGAQVGTQLSTLEAGLRAGALPTPSEWVVSMLLLTLLTGTIFSVGVATAMTLRKSQQKRQY